MGFADKYEASMVAGLRHGYFRYRSLKSLIDEMRKEERLGGKLEDFKAKFKAEGERLSRFAASQLEDMSMKVDALLRELPVDASDPGAKRISTSRILEIESELEQVCASVVGLSAFLFQNGQAAQEASGKLDALLAKYGKPAAALTLQEFDVQCVQAQADFQTLLVYLSDLYARARRVRSNQEGSEAVWVPPETFERKTTKYWVKVDDILEVKLSIIKHLPLLIFGRKQGAKADGASKEGKDGKGSGSGEGLGLCELKGERISDHQLISSVYFDSPQLHVYHKRLMRGDGAQMARVRWYGSRDDKDGNYPLFVERKTHREFWTGAKSVKERCGMEQKHAHAFLLRGELPPQCRDNQGDSCAKLLGEVHEFLNAKGERQVPMVRTQYQRSAFQEATSNAVRISIDCELKMIRESNAPRKAGDWCRNLSSDIPAKEIVHFPYVVLEVKLQDEQPEWITKLIEGKKLIAVSKFSKFQHGMALLYPTRLRNTPWWFLPDGKGGMSPATFEEMADVKDPYLDKADPKMFFDYEGKVQKRPEMSATKESGGGNSEIVIDMVPEGKGCGSESSSSSLKSKVSFTQAIKNYFVDRQDPSNGMHVSCLPIRSLSYSRKQNKAGKGEPEEEDNPRAAAVVRTRIEPKTFFANERTFLSWLQVSVIVIFMAFSLLEGSGLGMVGLGPRSGEKTSAMLHASQISGALIAPVGICFMLYALYMHRMRTMQILRRQTVRFDDQRGPVIMVCGLAVCCLVAYAISLSSIIAPRESL